ncbi:MAG: hypothetical protein QM599_07380 [Pseudoxanthomonas sp.]
MVKLLGVLALLVAASAQAQSIKAYQATPDRQVQPKKAVVVPAQCRDPANDINPYMQAFCRRITKGQPKHSATVLDLPGQGTREAAALGYACIAGLAMKRLPNGWEQVLDKNRQFVRCRDA